MICVLDACALIAFLRDEEGAEVVEVLLTNFADECIVHAINLCEVYYDFLRASDDETASSAISDLLLVGLSVCEDMDAEIWRAAGQIKVANRLSLADSFAVALAKRLGGTLVTSDHHEFEAIVAGGICSVQFFR